MRISYKWNPVNNQSTGVPLHTAGASTFWGHFTAPDIPGKAPWAACRELTDNGREFTLHNVRRHGSPSLDALTLTFMCAPHHIIPRGAACTHVQHSLLLAWSCNGSHAFQVQRMRFRATLYSSHTGRAM